MCTMHGCGVSLPYCTSYPQSSSNGLVGASFSAKDTGRGWPRYFLCYIRYTSGENGDGLEVPDILKALDGDKRETDERVKEGREYCG
jgi:hypothetical protein